VARRLLGGDTSAIYRLAGPDAVFAVQTVEGKHSDLASPMQFPPGYRQALQAGQPVAVSDSVLTFPESLAPDIGASALSESTLTFFPSLLAVPLIVADEAYGGLVLYYSESRVFSGEDVDLAVAFADQAALAIENARLHQQAEEAAVIKERDRLARELHDSVTQSLYSITLLAEGWKRLESAGRLEAAEDPLGELGEIAQQALKEMRLMVHDLRPPDLEEVGLLGALHLRLGAVEKRAGVDARLVAGDVPALSPQVEECLYRIAVEALNNSLKHADATEVAVRLQPAGEGVVLEVEDNGRGFDAGAVSTSGGIGLNSMRQRAEGAGGVLTIESVPGHGAKVQVQMGTLGTAQELGEDRNHERNEFTGGRP
jgi:signal transduction histidine kinase